MSKRVFTIEIDTDYIYEEMWEVFKERIEDDYGVNPTDEEFESVVEDVSNVMSKDSKYYQGRTLFEEWFYDTMPNTYDMMWDCLRDGLDTYIGKLIEEKFDTKEG